MNKRKYIIFVLLFLLVVGVNISSDKYSIHYQNRALTVNEASKADRSRATIYGNGTNEIDFVESPKVDLPKGEYAIKINYETDTNLNYVIIDGYGNGKEIGILEGDQYLDSAKKEKIIKVTFDKDVYNFSTKIHFCGNGNLVFKDMVIESVGLTNTDTIAWMILWTILFGIIGFLLYGKEVQDRKQRVLVFLTLIGITIFASYPLFSNYIISGHDIAFHLTRIEGIKNSLLSGQFPVRVHTSTLYDYGYAASIFYPELFLYFPALLRIMGVSVTGTVQIFLISINFFTATIMYFSAYKLSKVRSIGILSSVLYVFASYHLCDIYTRFAIGEALAMVFLPLLIYGVYELICNDYEKWGYVVLGATGVLQSHIITTIIGVILVGVVLVLSIKNFTDKKRILACMKAGVVAILINIWFLVPLISMMRRDMNVSSLARSIEDLTLYTTELFRNYTVDGKTRNIIGASMEGVMPLQIGLPILFGAMLLIYVLIQENIISKRERKLTIGLLGLGILSGFATTHLFPWKLVMHIPVVGQLAKMIQFPWRILAFTTALLSIAAGYGFFYIVRQAEARKVILVVIFAISSLLASHYLDDFSKGDIYCYKGAIIATTGVGTGEYYYKGTKYKTYKDRGELVQISGQDVSIENVQRRSGKVEFNLKNQSKEQQFVELPMAYYPFYTATLDGKVQLRIIKGNDNVLRVEVPPNVEGQVKVQYKESIAWLASDIISFLSIVIFIWSFTTNFTRVKKKWFGRNLINKA